MRLLALLVLAACGGGGAGGDRDGDGGGGGDGGGDGGGNPLVDADGDGFVVGNDCDDDDPAVNPDQPETPYNGIDDDCEAGTPDDDLDGDGFPLADDCDDAEPAIFPGAPDVPADGVDSDCDPASCTATGFGAVSTAWTLPPELDADWLDDAAEDTTTPCATGSFSAVTLEFTGDGLPDLLVTDNCDDAGVGTDEWLVYAGTAAGFAGSPTSYALPPPIDPDWLDDLFEDTTTPCAVGQFSASLLDLTGDGVPDLVVTDRCDDAGVGTDTWEVHAGGPAGFAAGPADFALPAPIAPDWLDDLSEDTTTPCAVGQFSASLLDLTADGFVDLVVTDSCDDAGVGTDEWLVHAGSVAGFAASPTSYALPAPIGPDWLDDVFEDTTTPCAVGQFSASVLDLTADGRPDLVITDGCDDAGVGTDTWSVHAGTASGFAAAATSWALPPPIDPDWLDDPAEDTTTPCNVGAFAASVLDLTHDGLLDLVITDACDDAGVGTDTWVVHAGTGAGFASSGTPWALPAPPDPDWLDDLAEDTTTPCNTGSLSAGLRDMTADGVPDLLVTDLCDDAGVGTFEWRVHATDCAQ